MKPIVELIHGYSPIVDSSSNFFGLGGRQRSASLASTGAELLRHRTWRRFTPRAVAVVSELVRSTFRFHFLFEASVMEPIVELIQCQFPIVDSIYGERGHIERECRAARFRRAHVAVGWATALERGSSVAVNERLSVVTIGRRALELGIWKPVGHVARILGVRLVNRNHVDGVE